DPPLLVNLDQGLRYTCTHDNGVNDRPIKMGCEEQPGVTPGVDAATALFSGHGTTGAASAAGPMRTAPASVLASVSRRTSSSASPPTTTCASCRAPGSRRTRPGAAT